ncbi:MAG: hypothetical protein JOZ63_15345, partial [Planctomycetaceae bacterium]|nr:hypothetical protein [Planctomycetaceae bacterium]
DRRETLRAAWLNRLSALVDSVQGWAEELGWSTRRIDKQMEDSQLGPYEAPALILQQDLTRVLLDPIASSAPHTEGVVDLYRMPAYDDVASLYYYDDNWHVHDQAAGTSSAAAIREAQAKPLSMETFREVLEELKRHVS